MWELELGGEVPIRVLLHATRMELLLKIIISVAPVVRAASAPNPYCVERAKAFATAARHACAPASMRHFSTNAETPGESGPRDGDEPVARPWQRL